MFLTASRDEEELLVTPWRAVEGLLDGVNAAFLDIDHLDDSAGWSTLRREIDEFLRLTDYPVRRFLLEGPRRRARLRRIASSVADRLRDEIARERDAIPCWGAAMASAQQASVSEKLRLRRALRVLSLIHI